MDRMPQVRGQGRDRAGLLRLNLNGQCLSQFTGSGKVTGLLIRAKGKAEHTQADSQAIQGGDRETDVALHPVAPTGNVLSRLPADSATREQQGKKPRHAIHSSMQQVNGRGELLRYRGGKDDDHLQVSQVRTATPRSADQPHACRDRMRKLQLYVPRSDRGSDTQADTGSVGKRVSVSNQHPPRP